MENDKRRIVFLICHDVIGKLMAGPGIRYYHLARVLSREFDVVLAVPDHVNEIALDNSFQVIRYGRGDWDSLGKYVKLARVIIGPSDIANDFPQIAESKAPLVIDGYDPLWSEWLALTQYNPQEQRDYWAARLANLNSQYLLGDFFICASERQRDWWLGLLEANGRINPWTYGEDPSLRRLIQVVPYGLLETPPQHTRQVIKGVWEGIKETDRLILWGGGLWPWLDPLTAIRAVAVVRERHPNVHLIFPGTKHPNPILDHIVTHTEAAHSLARELGLLDKAVSFGNWVPYGDWQNVLLESEIALTLHGTETIESRLAFRSRVLEYLWAGLPIVATEGDATSDLIANKGWGILVKPGDVNEVAAAILRLLEAPEGYKKRIESQRSALSWEQVAQPLIEFCREPRRASDKAALDNRIGAPFYRHQIDVVQAENGRLASEIRRLQTENSSLERTLGQSEAERAQFQAQAAKFAAQTKNLAELVQAFQNRRVVRLADGVRRLFDRSAHR